MLPVYVGSVKDLISQKKERLENNDARLILRRKLNGQRHDRVQNERQELQPRTAVSTLLSLESLTVRVIASNSGVASNEVIS